ncbi:uncharacterized protein LOC141704222 [Apium graveolens]|uniref:uncharacterized protein LOC141704222 n=1 Tax=Apium graveolens TaxID=4045 RepID=UPI003D79A395
MLNLPDSLYPDPIQVDNTVMSNGGAPANNNGPCDGASKAIDWPSASVEDLVVLLREPEHREKAISSLTQIKKQGRNQDLALHIWQSISTVFLLLSEVLSIYKSLTPEKLTMKDSSKVCDVLVLFEVGDPSTKVAVHCLLESGLFPLCLKSIEYGNELSQSARPITLKNLQDLFQKLSMGCGPNSEAVGDVAVGDVAGSSHLDG